MLVVVTTVVVTMVDATKAVVVAVVVTMVAVAIEDVVSSSVADDVKFGLELETLSRPRRISTRQNKSKLFESTHMVQKCWAKRWSPGGHLCMSMI